MEKPSLQVFHFLNCSHCSCEVEYVCVFACAVCVCEGVYAPVFVCRRLLLEPGDA